MSDTRTVRTIPSGPPIVVNIPSPPRVTTTTVQLGVRGLHDATPVLVRDGQPVAEGEWLTMRAGDIAKLVKAGAMTEMDNLAERLEAETRNRSAAAARRRRPIPVHLRVTPDGRSVAPR